MKKGVAVLLSLILIMSLMSGCTQTNGEDDAAETTSGSEASPSAGTEESASASSDSEFPDASNDPEVTLSFGGTAAADDLASQGMKKVAELVNERSGGTITINVFPASQLGDAMTQMELTGDGGQDMFLEGSNYMQDWGAPDSGILFSSFSCETEEEYMRGLESDLYQTWIDEFLEANNIRTLAYNWMRPPVEYGSNVEVRTFEDFQGLKIRSVPSADSIALLEAMGANPTSIAYNEVYLSLQTGVVEATIATLDAVYTMKFYEVIDYLLKIDAGFVNFSCWINETKYQSLTEAQQEILTRTCVEVGEWYSEEIDKMLDGYIEEMEAAGVEVITYDETERAKFSDVAKQMALEKEESGQYSEGLNEEFQMIIAG